MKKLLLQWRFSVQATIFLAGLILLTLPVSNAVWRETLGVSSDVDIEPAPTSTPLIITPTQTVTTPTATAVPSLEAVVMTLVPNTTLIVPNIDSSKNTPVAFTSSAPTNLPTTIPPPTDPTATERPLTVEPAATEPPAEIPTDPPTETSIPGG